MNNKITQIKILGKVLQPHPVFMGKSYRLYQQRVAAHHLMWSFSRGIRVLLVRLSSGQPAHQLEEPSTVALSVPVVNDVGQGDKCLSCQNFINSGLTTPLPVVSTWQCHQCFYVQNNEGQGDESLSLVETMCSQCAHHPDALAAADPVCTQSDDFCFLAKGQGDESLSEIGIPVSVLFDFMYQKPDIYPDVDISDIVTPYVTFANLRG
jgi:hypothetical protein